MEREPIKQGDSLLIPWAVVNGKVPGLTLVDMVRQQHRLLAEIERLRAQATRAATVETSI